MKRLVLVLAVGLTACGYIPGSAGDPGTASAPSPSSTSLYCVIDSTGTMNCSPDPTPVAIGDPMAPPTIVATTPDPTPVGAIGAPAAAAPAPPVAPAPPPPPPPPVLRVSADSVCSQCPAAREMDVYVYDLTTGQVPVIGACGTVTVRWLPNTQNVPVGTIETFTGCTSDHGVQAARFLAVTLAAPWSASGTTGAGSTLVRLDFSYQGGRVVSCSNPCP